ncbi:hypothetical protein N474_21230 [Pseudoalteromonas luteoviolacea CPMOR-2]|uniref:Uncharacterized protein n=1 Tax=Pseudoalteromonas luteoviolacea DSM 6061 TaxID=1365250 RepID=A0A161ZRK6_9GAMM|nr:hypothetical protein [Pseudoalteromonas luteoviolacea]KZN29675.1 hypothetical protein N475_05100 [Pseudoalteromonas luteoviolacea DSM 6061]KZN53235.1 hypothetical protein N474_21230 [Pseudoalteromonas luteoviolacea CPMOR-2]MBE0389435.1 hypothetical protein [Pseudoalteromonas luteoviolacea DSM 6061]
MNIKILGIIVLAATLIACGSDSYDPDVPEPPTETTTIVANGFDIQVYQRTRTSGINDDKVTRGSVYTGSNSVAFDDVIIGLDTQTEYVKAIAKQKLFGPFSLINKAYALSPVPPKVEQKISSISITSAYDFSDEHPSGSSLNDLFLVTEASAGNQFYKFEEGKRAYFTVTEYLENNTHNKHAHAGFIINLILNTAPELDSSITFYIEIELDNGKVFSLETAEITYQAANS